MKTSCALALSTLIFTAAAQCAEPPAWLDADSTALHPKVIELRRDFHANPELSNAEERTARVVAERLRALGLEVKTGVAKHGVVALLKGGKPGKCVAVRADMDALPIQEMGNAPFKSQQPGVMHACRHDMHTSSLLATVSILNQLKPQFSGNIKFIFQPGEERIPGGASLMINDGALENPHPTHIIGQHVMPELPFGKIGFCEGPYMASSDELYITVKGKGGHGDARRGRCDAGDGKGLLHLAPPLG